MNTKAFTLALALLPLALPACGDPDDTPKGDDTDADADTDADTDTDTDTDTDADTDVGPLSLTINVRGELASIALGLLPMDAQTITFGPIEQVVAVSDTSVAYEIDVPGEGSLDEFDPRDPDVRGQAWMMALFRDAEADDTMNPPGDYFTSFGEAVVVYLSGDLGADLLAEGYQEGWNIRRFSVQEGISSEHGLGLEEIELFQNLFPSNSLRLEGTYELAADPSTLKMMASSPVDVQDGDPVTTVWDREIETKDGNWGTSMNNTPPSSHRGLMGLSEFAAVEAIFAYQPGETDTYQYGDTIVGMVCYGTQRALPVHFLNASTTDAAIEYLERQFRPGWTLWLSSTKGPRPAETGVAAQLTISSECLN